MREMLFVTRLEDRLVPAVTFRFDSTFDTSGFFNDPDVLGALDRAGATVGNRLQDQLTAIAPAGRNVWEARYFDSVEGVSRRLPNLQVAANEIVVFVRAGDLGPTTLAEATSGSATASGDPAWVRNVLSRGQAGALADPVTDYGPWGGGLAFDTLTRWHFGTSQPPSNRVDFQSIVEHELAHLLGFGLGAASYNRFVAGRSFVGPNAMAVYGGPVPLDDDGAADHWAEGVRSDGRVASLVPTVAAGRNQTLTTLDFAGLADIGWEVGGINATAAPPPPAPPGSAPAMFAVGADRGGLPVVTLLDARGGVVNTISAFDAGFDGGVRVVTADFNGDGVLDIVMASGPGMPVMVRVVDGATFAELVRIDPFESAFTGGAFVSAGDLTGDGVPDLVITPDQGGGPRVRVFSGLNFTPIADFFGIEDPDFRGGARTAVGDINGDGVADLAVAAGFGGGPRVAAFSGQSVTQNAPRKLFADFFAFEQSLRDGVYLAIADLNRDGLAEVIAGAGPGGGPRVTSFDGGSLVRQNNPVRNADFFAGDPTSRGGVRLTTRDLDGDGREELITGVGDLGSGVGSYRARELFTLDPAADFEYSVFPGFRGGVFVG